MRCRHSVSRTQAIHAGQDPDPTTGAVVTPISLATTFAQQSVGVHRGYEYSRSGNPRTAVEQCLASLEGAAHGLAFASGLAAGHAVLRTLATDGRVLLGNDAYGGTYRLIANVWSPRRVDWDAVDLTDLDALAASWPTTPPRVAGSPTNPLLTCIDIEAVAALAHEHGARVVVDNTFATPYLQQPLALGADVVVHSATKYLGGHSDVVGGFLAVDDDELAERLRYLQNAAGAVPSPFDCYLVLRGVKTLAVRMDRHCTNARAVVDLLSATRRRARLLPATPRPSRPRRRPEADVRLRRDGQLHGARRRRGQAVAASTRVFTLAESLGAVESLIEHPGSGDDPRLGGRITLEVPDNLLRLSVGIESAERPRRRSRRRPRLRRRLTTARRRRRRTATAGVGLGAVVTLDAGPRHVVVHEHPRPPVDRRGTPRLQGGEMGLAWVALVAVERPRRIVLGMARISRSRLTLARMLPRRRRGSGRRP